MIKKYIIFGGIALAMLAVGMSFAPITHAAPGVVPSFVVENAPVGNGVTHSFTFYLGSITCPYVQYTQDTTPFNVAEGTSVTDSSITITDPYNRNLVRGTDFTASLSGENGFSITLLGVQPDGIYSVRASKNFTYDCPGGISYVGAGIGNGHFQYVTPVPSARIPSVTISATPNPILSGNVAGVTWSSQNAQTCYSIGFDNGGALNGSNKPSVPIVDDPATPTVETTTLRIRCVSVTGHFAEASTTLTPFFDLVHFYAYEKNTCSSAAGSRMGSAAEQDIRFDAYVDDGANGMDYAIYPDQTPNDGDDRVWGGMPRILGVYGNVHFVDGSGFSGMYEYCGDVPAHLVATISEQQEGTVNLYFAPVRPTLTLKAAVGSECNSGALLPDEDANALGILFGLMRGSVGVTLGVGSYTVSEFGTYTADNVTINDSSYQYLCTRPYSVNFPQWNSPDQTMTAYFKHIPTAPELSVVSECHDPSSAQNNLSWGPVTGATGYKIYRDSTFLVQVSATLYRDSNLSLGASHSYYVTAVSGTTEGPASNTITLSTPVSCSSPPITGDPRATLTIDPPKADISVDQTKQYTAWYDPDGGNGGVYGNFDVTTPATWSALNSAVATKIGQGLFRGIASGTSGIRAIYAGRTANALLNVSSPGSPDFSISVSPSLRTVQKPGSTSYTVTIVALNGFTGNVSLSIANVPSGITTNFAPQVINTQGSAQLTFTVSDSANEGRSTFTVTGTSGTLSHSAWADIDVTTGGVGGGFSCTMSTTPQSGDAPLITHTAVVVTDGVAPFHYYFDFGDGVHSHAHTPNPITLFPHIYSVEGSFTPSVHMVDVNSATADCSAPPICVGNCGPGGGGGSDPAVDLKINGKDDLTGADAIIQFDPFNVAQLLINWTSANVTSCSALRTPVGSSSADWGNYAIAIQGGDGETNAISPGLYDFSISCTPTIADNVPVEFVYCAAGDPRPQCQGGVVNECSIVASPTAILSGQSSTLSWSCTQPSGKSCYIDSSLGADVGDVSPIGGSQNVTPADDTYYTLQCTNVADSAALVRVGFLPILKEILPRF